jgi:hypothetical protein
MDSITTVVQNPNNPSLSIAFTSGLEPGETFDALIQRHANDLAQLRSILVSLSTP